MIIVEGTDGVGKTTFCHKLLEQQPTHIYAHFTRLPCGFDYYWGYITRASRRVVQDRFHMSEMAYARATGRKTSLSRERYRLVDGYLRGLGALTVVVLAHENLVRERYHGEQMFDLDTTLAAGEAFLNMVEEEDVDVDHTIVCDAGKPFPTDEDVTRVLDKYHWRQALIQEIANGQRNHEILHR